MTVHVSREAVAIYRQHHASIDLVLVDMMMPVRDGPGTIRELVRINPAVAIVAASGVASDASRTSPGSARYRSAVGHYGCATGPAVARRCHSSSKHWRVTNDFCVPTPVVDSAA